VPCRKEPYCGGASSCKGDPSYDDNRHDAVGDGTQNWFFDTGWGNNTDFVSSPAVATDGTIYIGSQNHNRLYAVNPDGSYKWNFVTSGRVYSPTVATSGTIYVGSGDGNLYAINPNGIQRWAYYTNDQVRTKPVVSSDGHIYFGSDDGRLHALFPDGGLAWSYDTFAYVRSSPALSPSGNRVYFGSDNGKFYALNAVTGVVDWIQTPFPSNSIRSSPAVGPDGTVYVGSDNGRLYALDGATGAIKWSVNTGEGVRSSPAVGSDGTIYVGSYNDRLYALNPTDGSQKWPPFNAGGDIESPITVDGNNHIYFGTNINHKVYALYADGSEKWSFTTGGDVRSKPFVKDDGTVYAWSFDWKLYAINQFANPKNYRDRLITHNSGSVGGVPVVVDNTDDWLKGASAKGPWAVRMEINRSQSLSDGTYPYELKTWLRQCNQLDCSDVLGTFYEDTRINYSPVSPTARPAQLEQTIKLLPADHQDFERVIFGFTSQTGAGDLQTATIREFQLSVIRVGDPTVTNDPNWP
jgi:outer membrane protein assembly factor BamB